MFLYNKSIEVDIMIKNIIFDIGNVLVTFDPLTYFKKFFDEETNQLLCKEVFSSNTWLAVDQGTVSEQEAREYFLNKIPHLTNEIHMMFDHWKGLMVEKEDTLQFLKDLKKQGFHIYLLSNIGEDSYDYCLENFHFFDLADGGVYSYQEKIVKPDEKIYTCLLERYKLLPGECIFLDDSLKNVKQANALGIHAIVFDDLKAVKDKLYTILKEEEHVKN